MVRQSLTLKSALKLALIALPALAVCVVMLLLSSREPDSWSWPDPRSAEAKEAHKERLEGDGLYRHGRHDEAEAVYQALISRVEGSDDADTQDQITATRIRLGYISGKRNDFAEAKRRFEEAAEKHKGTDAVDPNWGSLDDQALYQAAVCLAAEGKGAEAEAAFLQFIEERPRSPLIHAAHKRLRRLNGGETTSEHDEIMQAAVSTQEAHLRFEMAACGPKAIAHLLEVLGRGVHDDRKIADVCGTTEEGTTMAGLRKGLEAFGFKPYGFAVTRRDFERIPTPAIWLMQDHYVALRAVGPEGALVYDPMYRSIRRIELPDIEDTDFTAMVLTLQIWNPLGERK